MSSQTIVLGQENGDHIALLVTDSVGPPESTEPAFTIEVSGTPTAVRFKTFEALFAIEDVRSFLEHLREAETDNTVGCYLQSVNGEFSVKLRGQGTGTFDLDCEVSDAPDPRQRRPRSLVLYPKDLPRLIKQVKAVLAEPSY